ncbi:MAG TPA: hypothetical protein VHN14_21245 [Kofleriaceae bacterium]|jgi:CheY-like chemotaxis protein|nr:hypothetical protein [Kofleriaceae bacterium]
MDDCELARRLRTRFGADHLRLIAVTGYGQDADLARAREAGFDPPWCLSRGMRASTSIGFDEVI